MWAYTLQKIYTERPIKGSQEAKEGGGGSQALWWQKFSSVPFSRSVVSNFVRPHGLQHARLPCLSPTPGACSNSCPSSWWCHPTMPFSVLLFCSCLQSFPASGSFPMNRFFASGGQSFGASASASVLSMNIQDWFPLWLTGLISLQSKVLYYKLNYWYYNLLLINGRQMNNKRLNFLYVKLITKYV